MFKHIIDKLFFKLLWWSFWSLLEKLYSEYVDSYDTTIPLLILSISGRDLHCGWNSSKWKVETYWWFKWLWRHLPRIQNIFKAFTFIFNTFVMMQVFNFVNSKNFNEEVLYILFKLNVFEGITRNSSLFLIIIELLLCFKLFLWRVYWYGLVFMQTLDWPIQQWGISAL